MIKLILFLFISTAIAISISLVAESQGSVVINWIGYRVDMSILSAIVVTILSLFACFLLFFLISKLLSFGAYRKNKSNRKETLRYKKAMNYLSDGFIAIVAGNISGAEKFYKKAKKELKDNSLVNLLHAQIEYSKKNYTQAAELFRGSKKSKDTELEFIANKLYLQNAKKENNLAGIIKFSEEILKVKPKNEYAMSCLVKAYIEGGNAQKLEEIISYAERQKSKIFQNSKDEVGIAYVMIAKSLLKKGSYKKVLTYTKKAEKFIPDFPIINIIHAKAMISLGRTIRAASYIKSAWIKNPHPELMEIYLTLHKKLTAKRRLKKVKDLCKMNQDSFESNMAMSRVNFEAGNFVDAKDFARSALDMRKTESVYKLLLEIEKSESPNSKIVTVLSDRIKKAKKDYSWKCEKCGELENEWSINCKKCGSINSIKWSNP